VLGIKPATGIQEWQPLDESAKVVVGNLGALSDDQPVTVN
jgi:hypothetical protein